MANQKLCCELYAWKNDKVPAYVDGVLDGLNGIAYGVIHPKSGSEKALIAKTAYQAKFDGDVIYEAVKWHDEWYHKTAKEQATHQAHKLMEIETNGN
jgi:hypothetical protein